MNEEFSHFAALKLGRVPHFLRVQIRTTEARAQEHPKLMTELKNNLLPSGSPVCIIN